MSSVVLIQERQVAGQTVLQLSINRPDKRNALNADVVAGLRQGLAQAHANSSVRALLITGVGDQAFCAGADLQPGAAFALDVSQPRSDYANLLRDAQAATVPIVARVNGACLAGGMGLLGMADLAVASQDAVFGLPEVKVGVFPMQVMALLQRRVAPIWLHEWALTGESFDAATAQAAGLLSRVVPAAGLDAATDALLARLVNKAPTALRRGRYAMRAMEAMSLEQALAFAEGQISLCALSEDAREGLAAFRDKRPPSWPGR